MESNYALPENLQLEIESRTRGPGHSESSDSSINDGFTQNNFSGPGNNNREVSIIIIDGEEQEHRDDVSVQPISRRGFTVVLDAQGYSRNLDVETSDGGGVNDTRDSPNQTTRWIEQILPFSSLLLLVNGKRPVDKIDRLINSGVFTSFKKRLEKSVPLISTLPNRDDLRQQLRERAGTHIIDAHNHHTNASPAESQPQLLPCCAITTIDDLSVIEKETQIFPLLHYTNDLIVVENERQTAPLIAVNHLLSHHRHHHHFPYRS
ncbi:hypothetical protein L2E82_36399 [Cichorium intybus]|uniref:Uncharacterized protein n=1 Tax=Cichorium intybus TaxID=13427 RepID=A0ACB9BRG5_CICIN|nr:hypothetical protein L2E82_36399 [Cichorium intybus]